jgi:hypothetical protein
MESTQSIEARAACVPTGLDARTTLAMVLASPLKGVTYAWCGVFWIWMLGACLSDQYPVLRTVLEMYFGSTSAR